MRKILLSILILLILTGCERRRKQDVMILYPNWTEGIAISYLTKLVLEENGYTVALKRLEPGPIFAAISRGDADIYMDAWLPYTHEHYWKRFGDQLEVAGVIYDNGITGLVVPSYVEIDSIEELNDNKEKFEGGKIYGIAAGAGIHTNTEIAIKEYGLEFEQISSSETSMLAAVKRAISNNEWIVITGWKPHHMWNLFDLKPLSDSKGIYPTDEIKVISRKGFAEEQPELAKYFSQFKLDDKLIGELIDAIAIDQDPAVGVKTFYHKYKDKLDSWVVAKEVASEE
ncbi:MAG: glycine betaine ABC transporter substrate-binding protein [Bacteroidales bacterium]|nr:glycine betaine ABC transporter substrate-binding protein [Bacteroidales bacterium]